MISATASNLQLHYTFSRIGRINSINTTIFRMWLLRSMIYTHYNFMYIFYFFQKIMNKCLLSASFHSNICRSVKYMNTLYMMLSVVNKSSFHVNNTLCYEQNTLLRWKIQHWTYSHTFYEFNCIYSPLCMTLYLYIVRIVSAQRYQKLSTVLFTIDRRLRALEIFVESMTKSLK